ncbi:putative N-acetyltransferase YhbS [Pseudarthrobacter sp. W1I19]|uniref:N-acetyltransferase n=1 Tax=Pseudarthrobacter sp. W1I19 TaxID=3042288 RepID=UPI002787E46A|nr:N-acetyltransferase [Pseudarthrobacter sp. W1I19]MDQ0924389.1 putative N-acetyltransferase YhbS [Pseudarthrobacter sp. W1I19]
MSGEKNLQALLAGMHPVQRSGEYVYVLWPHGRPLAPGIEAAVREAEGLTVVLPRAAADREGLSYDFVASWITLEIHSALEAVGLTAAVSKALTEARISCNVLAGFHHDHLLVPVADAPRALEVLAGLSARSRQSPAGVPEPVQLPGNGRGLDEVSQPMPGLQLRDEAPADRGAILALTAEAFAISPATGLPADGEPVEVNVLRELFDSQEYLPGFSVVAELDGEVVGHVISTRGWVGAQELLGLGPISVTPRLQRQGIGSALMKETIARANAAGENGIALLGSTEYYPRFGFVPAASLGVLPPEEVWGDNFQLLPLALWRGGIHGVFRYADPFTRL